MVLLDEPSLPAVLLGRVTTASGYGSLRSVPVQEVRDGLRAVVAAAHAAEASVVLRCHDEDAPVEVLGETTADGVAVRTPAQASGAGTAAWDLLAGLLESGTGVVLTPVGAERARDPEALAGLVTGPCRQIGIDGDLLAGIALGAVASRPERGMSREDLARTARAAELLREGV